MNTSIALTVHRWFAPEKGAPDCQIARWIFLRALGLIYFSAFYSLIFQIRGLIGPQGILPASEYLESAAEHLGQLRFWFAPTLLWFSTSSHMLMALCWVGIIASLLSIVNVWPRAMLLICFVCCLSFVSAAGDFSSYQSDGMLLEAGFIALFFAPRGFWPGWGKTSLAPRASLFLLQWEWFRIYFESGVVKLASGDPEWRHLTAMDQYYQNGPLPTWIGWYVQHMPHWFHAGTVLATFALELIIVWMLFLPRRWRIACFLIATPWQIAVILTANYAFLNYIVLALGFLLLDDRFLMHFVPLRWRANLAVATESAPEIIPSEDVPVALPTRIKHHLRSLRLAFITVMLTWIFYATTLPMLQMFWREIPLPELPVSALEPFRIANQYGLFAVMTPNRYEIEFQGSNDGTTWLAYPYRYKPQDVRVPPSIYAPYQPRFDWNLWFASLGTWTEYPIVPRTEERLLTNDSDVLALFAGNPFPNKPPQLIRAVLWQYWFSTMQEKRTQGIWWHRKLLGAYAPTLAMNPDGKVGIVIERPLTTPQP
ncbi:hypothetical protein GCM10011507_00660 [Edaphobacter acidisoli]|uniref:Lipase maturation factor family protein n=1 Tax=Edaphobacter acidisoli TaxID=2040573 RepID=A0A916VYI4_9BACT|nr:lipase maturation factor family protein [Edaphobacter acidisoli]GGA53455.1 hypothetical protein GCM10011507_00660 [Edaphobacter acidisoli]